MSGPDYIYDQNTVAYDAYSIKSPVTESPKRCHDIKKKDPELQNWKLLHWHDIYVGSDRGWPFIWSLHSCHVFILTSIYTRAIHYSKTPLTMELLVIESVISGWKADISVVTRLCRGCVQICSFDTIFICNQTGMYVKYAWKMQSFKLLNLLKQTKRIICDCAIIVLLYQLLWWNIDIDLALM